MSGCDLMSDRLQNIGKAPTMSEPTNYEVPNVKVFDSEKAQIEVITASKFPKYKIYDDEQTTNNRNIKSPNSIKKNANSLWHPGTKNFFKSRAVGDIVSVKISMRDKAQLDNTTQKSRTSTNKIGIKSLFGLEKIINQIMPSTSQANSLENMAISDGSRGSGRTNRTENINTTVAVTVVNVLPSGNLVIKGSQEIRVNFELREITVTGIIRPEDIANDNSVTLDQIAEARVSYGGKGQITDYQQDKYGKQIIDAISPF